MITGEIKLYEEPNHWNSNSSTVIVKQETPEQRALWIKRCEEDLEDAKKLLSVGDMLFTKTNGSSSYLTVMSFVEKVEDMQKYQGNPCIVICKNLNYAAANPIQYSFNELNLDSLIKAPTPNV
jgi:hypothetical protein